MHFPSFTARTVRAAACIAAAALSLGTLAPAASAQSAMGSLPSVGSSGPVYAPNLDSRHCAANVVVTVPGGANTAGSYANNFPMGAYSRDLGVRMRTANPGRVVDRYVAYDSFPGFQRTYEQQRDGGLAAARTLLARDAAACPNAKFALFGYSMGADIASRLTQEIAQGRGPIPASRFTSAVFMANPNRGVNGIAQAGGAARSEGAFGALPGGYGDFSGKVLEICGRGDLVCDTPRSASLLARAFAETAILTNGFAPAADLTSGFQKLPADQKARFFGELPLMLAGMFRHTDYATNNGVGIAAGYLQDRLA